MPLAASQPPQEGQQGVPTPGWAVGRRSKPLQRSPPCSHLPAGGALALSSGAQAACAGGDVPLGSSSWEGATSFVCRGKAGIPSGKTSHESRPAGPGHDALPPLPLRVRGIGGEGVLTRAQVPAPLCVGSSLAAPTQEETPARVIDSCTHTLPGEGIHGARGRVVVQGRDTPPHGPQLDHGWHCPCSSGVQGEVKTDVNQSPPQGNRQSARGGGGTPTQPGQGPGGWAGPPRPAPGLAVPSCCARPVPSAVS